MRSAAVRCAIAFCAAALLSLCPRVGAQDEVR